MAESAPSADELLQHTDWLLQLARVLVGDANADDVVQETYEVAIAKPPKHAGPLRPWLGGVARNVARMATRGRVRRQHREEAAPLANEVPTPEALVERVQMQQHVARIVLELPEPLRATLLLRFFEGLTAAEIARAQGIPAATVRGRIKDALDRVRATLDQHHGDRRRWALLLAPLPVAAARSATAAIVGGIAVKSSVKIGIAIVVVLALVLGTRLLGWWGKTGEESKPPPTAGSGSNPAPIAVTPAKSEPSGPPGRVLEVVHDDDPKGALRLEGQVIDEHDAPVGGAHVAIDANPPIIVDSETDGSFTIEGLIPRDYRLEATAGDGYAGPARLRLTTKTEPVTLRLRRGGSVDVVVTAVTGGKPIAGAEVELRSTLTWHAKSDANGVAQLRGVGAVWAPLAVKADGFAPGGLMLGTSGDPAAPARVAIALAGGAAIAGRVIDDTGKPVDGARVVATSASDPFPLIDARRDGVATKSDGTFTIPTAAAGTWRLTASQGDHAPATSAPITVDGLHARSGVELKLEAGGVIRGVVRDKAGQPVASAEIRVVTRGHVDWRARRQALSGADGTFAITGLARRAMDVVASHDSGASAIAPADLGAKPEVEVTLALDVVGVLEGMVVDKAGTPIGDAQVIAEPEWSGGTADRTEWSVRGIQETVTDQGGKFRFAGLPDGSFKVRAAKPGASEFALSLATPTTAKPGAPPLRLVIAADGHLVGKVELDGKVPARFAVAIGGTYAMPFSTKDGKFSIAAPGGTHAIVISGPGFVDKTLRDVVVTESKDTDLGTIAVTGGRSVSGRVLDANGSPVVKAKVAAGMLLTGGGNELFIPDESIGAKSSETDGDGRFSIEGFPPAAVTVIAGKDGIGRSASVRLPPGPDSAHLELVLQPTAGLDGKITKDGAPAGDIVIIANPLGANASNFFTTTGPDGTFALDSLAPGPYTVFPMFGGGGNRPKDMYVRRVEVVLGKRTHVDIDATPGPIALTVTVKSSAGGTAPAQIIALGIAIQPATMEELRDGERLPFTDQVVPIYARGALTGTVEITGMRPGVHTVCALPMVPGIEDFSKIPMKCTQVKLETGTPKKSVDVVVTIPKV
ncbi:MAG: sigma-70 family RNA polymerase sigma factor [Kofleriaceae bacterium]